jgi:hypothetical protein
MLLELAAKYKIRAVFVELQPSGDMLTRISAEVERGDLKIGLGGFGSEK